MNTRERFKRTYEHKEADRVPIIDIPWQGTLARWHKEGMPLSVEWEDYFGIDKLGAIGCDFSPRYPEKILEETEGYIIKTTGWGVTLKHFKEIDSTPQFLDFKISDSAVWQEAKKLMAFDMDRFNLARLKENYPKWVAQNRWIKADFWFGFDVAHSWMSGTETILIALMEEPEWVADIFNTYLDSNIMHFEQLLKAGYDFDEIYWPDDLGYKNSTFFSLDLYRRILKPVQKRAVEWAHGKGKYAHLHSCGYITPFVSEFAEIGIDALNPLEVKAGVDSLKLKKEYGAALTLHGGLNAMHWDNLDAALADIDRLVPLLKKGGGYIFSSDHSIPSSVSLENYKAIVQRVKEKSKF